MLSYTATQRMMMSACSCSQTGIKTKFSLWYLHEQLILNMTSSLNMPDFVSLQYWAYGCTKKGICSRDREEEIFGYSKLLLFIVSAAVENEGYFGFVSFFVSSWLQFSCGFKSSLTQIKLLLKKKKRTFSFCYRQLDINMLHSAAAAAAGLIINCNESQIIFYFTSNMSFCQKTG